MIEPIFLPFGGDAEGDITFESPEKMADFYAPPDSHDGMQVIGHGHRDHGRPTALLFEARCRFEDDAPTTGIIEMTYSSVLMAKGDKYGVSVAGPVGASMGECLALAVVHSLK